MKSKKSLESKRDLVQIYHTSYLAEPFGSSNDRHVAGLEAIVEASRDRLVSCEERLPENKTFCLIYRDCKWREVVEYALYEDKKWRATVGTNWLGVTHWQPLPQPPNS